MSRKYIENDFITGMESILSSRLSFAAWFIPLSIMSLIIILLLWSWFSEVDIVSPATGEIVTTQKIQLVQPKEVGVVSDILVRSGDVVSQGQTLVLLDDQTIKSDITQIKQEIRQLKIEHLRLAAMQICLQNRSLCESAFAQTTNTHPILEKRAKALYHAQWAQYYAQVEMNKAKMTMAYQERILTEKKITDAQEMLPFYEKREARLRNLQQENLTALSRVEESEEKKIAQQQQLAQSRLELVRISAKERVAQQEAIVYQREYKEKNYAQLFDNSAQLELKEQALLKLNNQLKEKRLISPIDGQVYDVKVATLGGVVQSGEILMKIVPINAPLEVEIKIANKDVGFVNEGDKVKVKLDAYNFTRYGAMSGVIRHISDAAVLDEQLGAVYPATIRIEKSNIKVQGKEATIIPGMTAVVDIYQGKRAMAEYILTPLLRYKDEALRER